MNIFNSITYVCLYVRYATNLSTTRGSHGANYIGMQWFKLQ